MNKGLFTVKDVNAAYPWLPYRTILNRVNSKLQPTLNTVSGTGQEYLFSWGQLVYAGVLDQLVVLGLRHTRGEPQVQCDIFVDREGGILFDRQVDGAEIHEELVRFIQEENAPKFINVTLKYVGKWASVRGRKAMRLVFYLAAFPALSGSKEELDSYWLSRGLENEKESFKVFSRARIDVTALELQAKRALNI